jgi:hypothetical protein
MGNAGVLVISRVLLFCLVAIMPSVSHAEWRKATSEHFIIYGDMPEDRLRGFAERVEKFDALLRALTGQKSEASPNKLVIFAVRDATTVQKVIGKGAGNVAGFYSPGIAGSIAVTPKSYGSGGKFSADSDTILFHEYAHHFMLQYFAAGYPAWYVEGFAEYYSTTDFKLDGSIAVGLPAYHRAGSLVNLAPYPVDKMFAADAAKLNNEESARFYGYAWLMTHYLSFEPTRKGQLTAYLKAFAKGVPAEKAASDAFGDSATLQADLKRYLNANKINYRKISGLSFPPAEIKVDLVSPAESTLMPLYIRFMNDSNRQEEIDSFVNEIRIEAVRHPNEPRALEMLAEGELDAERFGAATKANDAFLALRPTDGRGLLRRARIAAAIMRDTNDFPGGWKAVRSLVVKANRAAPDDPFPLMEYYDTFRQEGIKPPTIVGDGLNRALELAPQVPSLRFAFANYLINTGKRDDARIVLAPLLNNPHSPGMRDAARAMLTRAEATMPADKPAASVAEGSK